MPKIVDHDAMRTRILDAALGCFTEQGYHATKMTDVARAAKMAKGSLYRYFDSKDALTDALVRRYFDAIRDEVSSYPAPPTLGFLVFGLRQALPADRLGATRMFFDVLGPGFAEDGGARQAVDDFLSWISGHYAGHLRALQAAGEVRRDIDPDRTGAAIASMLDGLIIHQALFARPDSEFAGTSAAAIALIEQGLRPLAQP
ncbi:MAG: TetR/AcrR family transcriptional regulator [Marinibacterium sp.]|nr:TetR/AcrR family transcriptional regulator [Marinibacterium sp.]